jgi:hypothetical protein
MRASTRKTLFLTIAAFVLSMAGVFIADKWALIRSLEQERSFQGFSVECKNDHTGVIDRETVNVDAATVTIEAPPGSKPDVFQISVFSPRVKDKSDDVNIIAEDPRGEIVWLSHEMSFHFKNWAATLQKPSSVWLCHPADHKRLREGLHFLDQLFDFRPRKD